MTAADFFLFLPVYASRQTDAVPAWLPELLQSPRLSKKVALTHLWPGL